jgi:hypothetical protein
MFPVSYNSGHLRLLTSVKLSLIDSAVVDLFQAIDITCLIKNISDFL